MKKQVKISSLIAHLKNSKTRISPPKIKVKLSTIIKTLPHQKVEVFSDQATHKH